MNFNFFMIESIESINMKKSVNIQAEKYEIEVITNGMKNFDQIVSCLRGFNGDKWGDAYSGFKLRAKTL